MRHRLATHRLMRLRHGHQNVAARLARKGLAKHMQPAGNERALHFLE
jgi:hypothetical protein